MNKAIEMADFLIRLVKAQEKTGLELHNLSETRVGVSRKGTCVFEGSYGEACRFIFTSAEKTKND